MAPASGSVVAVAEEAPPPGADGPAEGRTPVWAVVGLWILIAVPLVIALVALARPRWFPVLDLAQTELRVRDVASGHPPLIGLPGRIGNLVEQGSHPGPLSFWALWPLYAIFGETSWAMQVATTGVNLVAVGLVLWMARRRGGTGLLLAMGAVLAVLLRFYGPDILTQAWNPYLPLAWWLVFVVGVWCVLCEDLPVLPVAVFAAMFCLQTHISYVGLVLGLGALAGGSLIRSWYVHRADREFRRRLLWWTLGSAALAAILLAPAVIQQLTETRGNLDIIWKHFTDPPEDPIGIGEGIRLLLIHLNPWRLVAQQDGMTGSMVPGALFLAVWAVSVAFAWRLRDAALIRLDVMLGAALVLALSSMSRIFGYLWFYLVLWSWALTALMLLAVGWTLVRLVAPRLDEARRTRLARTGAVALGAVIVVMLALFSVDSADVDSPDPRVSEALGALVRPTVRALDEGTVPGGGRDGRYQVTWVDTVNIGGPGYGLLNELERAGFDVGLPDVYGAIVTSDRVLDAKDATAVVHLAVGQRDIDFWRARPETVEIASYEPRNEREREEYQRLRARVIRELTAAGLPELAAIVDDNLFMATFQPQVPEEIQPPLVRMITLGQPSAIFVGPPDDAPAVRT
jgi:hypothetical protein